MAQSYDAPATDTSDRTTDRRFYGRASYLLMSAKANGRPFVESDAVAAVFLISYHNLVGGGTGWLPFAEVAYDWLVQTGIHQDQNPKLTLMNMSAPQRLAAKLTMVTCHLTSCVIAVPTDLMSFVDSGLISCPVSSSTAHRASFPSSNTSSAR